MSEMWRNVRNYCCKKRDLLWVWNGICNLFVSQSFIIRLSVWPFERPRLWFTVSQSSVKWCFCMHVKVSQFNQKCFIYLIKSLRAFVVIPLFSNAVYLQTCLHVPLLPPSGCQRYDSCLVHCLTFAGAQLFQVFFFLNPFI